LEIYNTGLSFLPGNPALLFGRAILYLEKADTARACMDIKLAASKGHPEAAGLSKKICR